MKAVVLSTLFSIALSVKCTGQTPSLSLQKEGGTEWEISWAGISLDAWWECGTVNTLDYYSCASTQFEGSLTKDAWDWATFSWVPTNYTFKSEIKACALNTVCEKLAGGTNSCQYAEWEYVKWRPTSCDESADYDAVTETRSTKISLSCCDDTDHCNKEEDYDPCTDEESFGSYVEDMQQCWNDVRRTFMKDLLCDDEGNPTLNLLTWSDDCTEEDGSWAIAQRGNAECMYTATCTDDLRNTLAEFGECACTAATTHGYTGDFIATAMEENWDRYCPNIELSCSTDTGIVELLYKYWKIRYKLFLAVASDLISNETLALIKAKVAEKLNADPGTITVTLGDGSSVRRRFAETEETEVLIEFKAEDENTGVYGENQLDSNFAAEIGTDIGYTVTSSETDKQEGSDATQASFSTENENNEDKASFSTHTFCVWILIVIVAIFR